LKYVYTKQALIMKNG